MARLIHEYSLQFSNLVKLGTGPKGRLTKGDVLKYVAAQNVPKRPAPLAPFVARSDGGVASGSKSAKAESVAVSAPGVPLRVQRNRTGPAAYTEEPTDQMRRVIAARLTESKTTVPHAFATREINLGPVSALRKKLNASLEGETKLSVTYAPPRWDGTPAASVPANPSVPPTPQPGP